MVCKYVTAFLAGIILYIAGEAIYVHQHQDGTLHCTVQNPFRG